METLTIVVFCRLDADPGHLQFLALWTQGHAVLIITIIIEIIIIMSVFLESFSMCNMLNCAEQMQIQKYCLCHFSSVSLQLAQLGCRSVHYKPDYTYQAMSSPSNTSAKTSAKWALGQLIVTALRLVCWSCCTFKQNQVSLTDTKLECHHLFDG